MVGEWNREYFEIFVGKSTEKTSSFERAESAESNDIDIIPFCGIKSCRYFTPKSRSIPGPKQSCWEGLTGESWQGMCPSRYEWLNGAVVAVTDVSVTWWVTCLVTWHLESFESSFSGSLACDVDNDFSKQLYFYLFIEMCELWDSNSRLQMLQSQIWLCSTKQWMARWSASGLVATSFKNNNIKNPNT